MNQAIKVAIIGAGVSGISAARKFEIEKIDYKVFEANDSVGGPWAKPYFNLRTQAPVYLMDFPDKNDFQTNYGGDLNPKAEDFHKYLNDYVKEKNLIGRIKFNTEVIFVSRNKLIGKWVVRYINKITEEINEEIFDFLVVSGCFYKPYIPLFKNKEFRGKIIHVTDFKNPEIARDKKVIIIGLGKSSYDVANALLESKVCSKPPTFLFREMRWPFAVTNKSMGYLLTYSLLIDPYIHTNSFEVIIYKYFKWLRKLLQDGLKLWIKKNYHFDKLGLEPKNSLSYDWSHTRAHMTPYLFEEAVNGNIILKQGNVDFLENDHVILDSNENIEADLIICGTGYENFNYTYFEEEYQNIMKEDDDGFYLFREIIHPKIPNCAFIGRTVEPTYVWQNQATWLSFLIKGEVSFSEEYIIEEIEKLKIWKRRTYSDFTANRAKMTTGFSMRYSDLLMKDLNLEEKVNYFEELFGKLNHSVIRKYSKYYLNSVEEIKSKLSN